MATTMSSNSKSDGHKKVDKTSVLTPERTEPVSHWGEYLPSQSPSKSMSVVDMESATLNPKSIELEGPHLHQPSSSSQHKTNIQQNLPSDLCRPDAMSIHTIQLLKHNRRIRAIIAASQQLQADSNKWEDRTARPRLQSLPATPLMMLTAKRSWCTAGDNGSQLEPHDEPPRLKTATDAAEIDGATAKKLTKQAVATICAHAGYEMSHESALDTLTDVLGEYLTKVCKLLRVAVDREALTGYTGFQDVFSQVMQEIGVGSTETLYKFWKIRIKDYHALIQKRNIQLREQYEKMRNPADAALRGDSKSLRLKEEPFVDIQFPDSEQDSEITPEATEQPSQPMNFQSLNTMELDDQSRTSSAMVEDESHWYPASYVKTEPGTESGARQEEDQTIKTEDQSDQEDDDVSPGHKSPPVVVDVDVTSPQSRSSQEAALMNPKKKRKK